MANITLQVPEFAMEVTAESAVVGKTIIHGKCPKISNTLLPISFD